MKRREFILGTGAASLGGSALIGTGAFSRVASQREVGVEVVGDPEAYLGFDACRGDDGDPTPNSEFVGLDARGRIAIDMGPSGAGGTGVNGDAITSFDGVFQISNQGKTRACVDLEYDPVDMPESGGGLDAGDPSVVFYQAGARDEGSSALDDALVFDPASADPDDPKSAVSLPVGESVCVGIQTRTFGIDGTNDTSLLDGDRLRIVADTDGQCAVDGGDGGGGGGGDGTDDGEDDGGAPPDISFVAFGNESEPGLDDVEAAERKGADADGSAGGPVSVAFEAAAPLDEVVLFTGGGPGAPPGDQRFLVATDVPASGVITTRDAATAPDGWIVPDESVLRSETPREPSDPCPDHELASVKFEWDEADERFAGE
ncbi:hypothetical protein [Halorubrum sp. LN27]|uniref:hypothetical protein n=1 Tax=Halorubrum sp. LN27 TaxID=2801032 RepID=UPI00190C8E05|nr:hypothetical protein [Halorubrum sp. LN27]